MNNLTTYSLLFVLLVLSQPFLFAEIHLLNGYLTPSIYPLFILLLPFSIPSIRLLWVGFFMGLVVDLLMGTGGIHTMATTFLAFLRPQIIDAISPRGKDMGFKPTPQNQDLFWFFNYLTIAFLAHHLVWFMVAYGSFSFWHRILLRTLVSSLVSAFIAALLIYGFSKKR